MIQHVLIVTYIIFHQLQNAKRGFGHWEASNGIKLMEKLDLYLQSNQLLYPGEGEKIITIVDDILNYALDKGHVRFRLCPILTVLKLS